MVNVGPTVSTLSGTDDMAFIEPAPYLHGHTTTAMYDMITSLIQKPPPPPAGFATRRRMIGVSWRACKCPVGWYALSTHAAAGAHIIMSETPRLRSSIHLIQKPNLP